MEVSSNDLIDILRSKEFVIFDDDSKNYNLNLIGIRSINKVANNFDDFLCVLWKFNGNWNMLKFKMTTDPGLFYLKQPMNSKGTAIVKEGQYRGLWKYGKHKGYIALQQSGPVTVFRDFNRDNKLDFIGGTEQEGVYELTLSENNASYLIETLRRRTCFIFS